MSPNVPGWLAFSRRVGRVVGMFRTTTPAVSARIAEATRPYTQALRLIRKLGGSHYPAGTALVHIRCGCNKRIAAIETDADGQIVTLWFGRRFRGVPDIECPDHGRLALDDTVLAEKISAARRSRKPQTLKLRGKLPSA